MSLRSVALATTRHVVTATADVTLPLSSSLTEAEAEAAEDDTEAAGDGCSGCDVLKGRGGEMGCTSYSNSNHLKT